MYKYKKRTIYFLTFIYIVLTIIEIVKYLFSDASLFGLIYILNSLFIIFLFVPCAYNYKKYFSKERISKLIIIILFGIFNSFLLEVFLINSMSYEDNSLEYIKSIFIYKNVLKSIVYLIICIFTFFEFRLEKVLRKVLVKKVD